MIKLGSRQGRKKGIVELGIEYIMKKYGGIQRRVNWNELLLRSKYGWNERYT